jgi:hypothetical protein
MGTGPVTYATPSGTPLRLRLPPRLESWNAKGHPDQVRLREFVAHVRELVDPVAEAIAGPLAFRLDVGLADSIDPLWQRDLDNYLFPIARALPDRYVAVWGTKTRGGDSFVTVDAAVPTAPPEWPAHPVPRAPGSEAGWKRAVRAAVRDAEQLPPGPVGLQLSLAVGPRRSWTNSWKRTIDGLEPLLGRTYATRDWNPQDGRIVRLGLHVAVAPALEDDVEATIWARPADLDWPELGWFKRMDDAQRGAFMAAHQAVLEAQERRAHPQRRTGRGRPPAALPAGVHELKTEDHFQQAVAEDALIVKTDSDGPPKLHVAPKRCSGVTAVNFHVKVIVGGGKNGGYYRTRDPAAALLRWPRLAVCGSCRRLDPARAAEMEVQLG